MFFIRKPYPYRVAQKLGGTVASGVALDKGKSLEGIMKHRWTIHTPTLVEKSGNHWLEQMGARGYFHSDMSEPNLPNPKTAAAGSPSFPAQDQGGFKTQGVSARCGRSCCRD